MEVVGYEDARAVHDQGRLDNPGVPPFACPVPGRGDPRAGPGHDAPLPHAVTEEIYLLVGGGGTMELDGETRVVGEGDAILIPPGAWHELRAGPDGVRLLCCCVPPYSHADTYF